MNDYSAFADDAPDSAAITDVGRTAMELYEAELEVLRCEAALKKAQARVRDLSEKTLPDLLEEAKIAEVKLANGGVLSVEKKLNVSPLKANRPKVLQWLEETGHASKIKRAVRVTVGKDPEKTEALVKELAADGFADVEVDVWVEPATLTAHVRKCLEAGDELDMDLLGARTYSKAKITGAPAPVFDGE